MGGRSHRPGAHKGDLAGAEGASVSEKPAHYRTNPPQSFQKLVDKLLENVVAPRLSSEVRIFFDNGTAKSFVVINRVSKLGGIQVFEHKKLI
jgi:hypothetical protein